MITRFQQLTMIWGLRLVAVLGLYAAWTTRPLVVGGVALWCFNAWFWPRIIRTWPLRERRR